MGGGLMDGDYGWVSWLSLSNLLYSLVKHVNYETRSFNNNES